MTSIPTLQHVSDAEYAALCHGAEVLEQDAHGLKVLLLQDGSILKIFRLKRWWSSARFYPYSRHFCRNAIRLAGIGVPTVSILARYQLSKPGLTAVRYQPLPGTTLRNLARSGDLGPEHIRQLGEFVALLHKRGVYFRSLHLGNIVRTQNGELGLIDVADLSIMPWPLLVRRRLRNFRHLCRGREDRQVFGVSGWRNFCEAYAAAMDPGGMPDHGLISRAEKIFKGYARP